MLNSISKKVLAGYSAIIVIVAVVASILFSGLIVIDRVTNEFSAKSLPAVQSVNHINKSLNQTLITAYGLYGYTIEKADYEQIIEAELTALKSELSALKQAFPNTEPVKLDILKDRLTTFKQIMTASEVDWDAAREALGQVQAEATQLEGSVASNGTKITEQAELKSAEISADVSLMLRWLTFSVICILAITAIAYLFTKKQIVSPVTSLASQLDVVVENNDLRTPVSVPSADEVSLTADSINKLLAAFKKVNMDISQSAAIVRDAIEVLDKSATLSDNEVEKLSQVVSELSRSSEVLAQSISDSAERSESASSQAAKGASQVALGTRHISETSAIIADLSKDIDHSAEMLLNLKHAGDKVSDVVKTIADIADQTNLLALNAAIEAARAGESGRGFAVVAGEVRTLASRTHDSTFEINSILEEIVNSISSTVSLMEVNKSKANEAVSAAETTVDSLTEIQQTVTALSEENHELATVAQNSQQDVQLMQQELQNITNGMAVVASSSSDTKVAAETLTKLSSELEQVAQQFKV